MPKLKKILKVSALTLLAIGSFIAVINIIPPPKVIDDNPFIVGENLPHIAAHRGGGDCYPENTMKAYKGCVNDLQVDIIETDLWLTKDEKLVYHHDESINRTSDAKLFFPESNNKVADFTLEELKNFNFGYNFEINNETPYKNLVSKDDPNRKTILQNNDLQIVEVHELFEKFYQTHPDLLFIVEIKNSGSSGQKAADILANTLEEYPNYQDQIVIGTFNPEVEKYLKKTYPNLLRGASTDAATTFVVTQLLKVNLFDPGDFVCLQIPIEEAGLNLAKKTYINRAHRRNIAVQYWTINDPEEMRTLIELGCDAIMTDRPDILKTILEEYK